VSLIDSNAVAADDVVDLWGKLAHSAAGFKRFEEACSYYTHVIEMLKEQTGDPRLIEARWMLTEALIQLDELDRAEALATENYYAARAEPLDFPWFLVVTAASRGQVSLKRSDRNNARGLFLEAIQLAQTHGFDGLIDEFRRHLASCGSASDGGDAGEADPAKEDDPHRG
jgi:hypothetical protein